MSAKYNISHLEVCLIKNNQHIILNGNPCKVLNFSHAKTGKHGHMKVSLNANDMITNKNVQWMGAGHNKLHTFTPVRINYQAINIENNDVDCLDENANTQTIKVTSDEILKDLASKIEDNDMQIEVMYLPIMKTENEDDVEDYCLVCGISVRKN